MSITKITTVQDNPCGFAVGRVKMSYEKREGVWGYVDGQQWDKTPDQTIEGILGDLSEYVSIVMRS